MKNFAFTLAEVLITIGIIGIVAAMTLPGVITSYQKQETVSRLKKVYATVGSAFAKAAVEYGDLLIVASASGETDSVCRAAQKAKSQQIDIVTITATPKSTLLSIQKPLIFVKSSTKFNTSNVTVQPLGSLFEQVLLIVFDAVILKISRAEENMNSDMAKRHASIE